MHIYQTELFQILLLGIPFQKAVSDQTALLLKRSWAVNRFPLALVQRDDAVGILPDIDFQNHIIIQFCDPVEQLFLQLVFCYIESIKE